MKKITFLLISVVLNTACFASGWESLNGENESGEMISITPAWDTWEVASGTVSYNPDIDGDLFYVDVEKSSWLGLGKSTKTTYKDLRCEFENNKSGERIRFLCKKSGKSPLSGTSYKIVPNKNPRDCSYQAIFICTQGCDRPATPRKLTQAHWECP